VRRAAGFGGPIVGAVVALALVADRREAFAAALRAAPIWLLAVAVALQLVALLARSEAWNVGVGAAGATVTRRPLRIDPVDIINLPNHRDQPVVGRGVPQHAFTTSTLPTEAIANMPGARALASVHLGRQRDRGHHPHDSDEPIGLPLVWREGVCAVVDGSNAWIDLTSWKDRPIPTNEVTLVLINDSGAATALKSASSEPTGRRWSAPLPPPRCAGHLIPGRYRVRVIADGRHWDAGTIELPTQADHATRSTR